MTIEDGIGWTWVSNQDKEALRGLQSFQCTTDRPKSPGGRALRHPKPWELEVQSYFRDRGCGRAKEKRHAAFTARAEERGHCGRRGH